MTRTKKPSGSDNPKTGDQFIEFARNSGAMVSKPNSDGFVKISTPKGSMYVTPGNNTLDRRTRKNYKHWLRLLSLLTVLVFTSKFWWWPFVHLLQNIF